MNAMIKTFSMTIVSVIGTAGLAFAGDAAKPGEAKSMEMGKPPQEVTDLVKGKTGTWKCDGTAMGMDGKEMKFKGTMKSKADLDGYWVHDSFDGTMGEGKTSMKFKFESFETYDPNSKKWRSLFMENYGGSMVGWSDGVKDGKMDTSYDIADMRGKGQFKDHADMTDPKKGVHLWGEESRDNGKTWNKSYDMICKK